MGLDASIYKRRGDAPREEIHYWRKNGMLHQVMERIYRQNGGKAEMFNCIELPLPKMALKAVIRECRRQRWHHWTKDVQIFKDAIALTDDGWAISYDSWW